MKTLAELRHAIRGTLNALKLCVSALEMPLDTSEKLAFLADVEIAAEKLATLMAEVEAQPPEGGLGGAVDAVPAAPAGAAPVVTHAR